MERRLLAILAAAFLSAGASGSEAPAAAAQAGLDAFNRAVVEATKNMDNAASLALWEEDGVSVLAGAKPLVGRPAIAAFLEKATSGLAGARMESFTMDCSTIAVSGDWATESCVEHQVVRLSGGKPPFDGRGNLLYLLHRGDGGRWRIGTEVWTPASERAAPPPEK
ncbi:MAG: YybH family protein [Thermoanaerobaculia bacterium]